MQKYLGESSLRMCHSINPHAVIWFIVSIKELISTALRKNIVYTLQQAVWEKYVP